TQFGLERWRNFNPKIWREMKEEALAAEKPLEINIYGGDVAPSAIRAAVENIGLAQQTGKIKVEITDFRNFTHHSEKGMVMLNPQYGERIKTNEILTLYKEIGDKFKREFSGFTAWVLSSDERALKHVGLKPSRKI